MGAGGRVYDAVTTRSNLQSYYNDSSSVTNSTTKSGGGFSLGISAGNTTNSVMNNIKGNGNTVTNEGNTTNVGSGNTKNTTNVNSNNTVDNSTTNNDGKK